MVNGGEKLKSHNGLQSKNRNANSAIEDTAIDVIEKKVAETRKGIEDLVERWKKVDMQQMQPQIQRMTVQIETTRQVSLYASYKQIQYSLVCYCKAGFNEQHSL